jgi:hypothetical protein
MKKRLYMVDGIRTVVCDSSDEKEDNLLAGVDADLKGDQGLARSISEYGQKELGQIYGSWKSALETVCEYGSVDSILDIYGGTGRISAMAKNILSPSVHMAFDASEDCVNSMKETIRGASVLLIDSHKAISRISDGKFDLVLVDMYAFTYNRYATVKKFERMLSNAFRISSGWLILTDSAVYGISKFHKNRASYEKSLGVDMCDWSNYYPATAEKHRKRYGFRLVRAIQWRHEASIVLFAKNGVKAPKYGGLESADDQKQVKVEDLGFIE